MRIALQTGASLVPCYALGANQAWTRHFDQNSLLYRISSQLRVSLVVVRCVRCCSGCVSCCATLCALLLLLITAGAPVVSATLLRHQPFQCCCERQRQAGGSGLVSDWWWCAVDWALGYTIWLHSPQATPGTLSLHSASLISTTISACSNYNTPHAVPHTHRRAHSSAFTHTAACTAESPPSWCPRWWPFRVRFSWCPR